MPYETTRIVAEQSYQHWIANEIAFFWLVHYNGRTCHTYILVQLVDKSRLSHLLLLGSLSAGGFIIGELILIQLLGVAEYLYMFTNGIIARALFLMIIAIEQSQPASKTSSRIKSVVYSPHRNVCFMTTY
ncbi:hypothetical protein SRRS_38480 [Sporomusa rhizae]|uniref:hypothetical protein n=1 Tax=Sporomusa rhizae TaxID=357999 RepID=UPI00352A313B